MLQLEIEAPPEAPSDLDEQHEAASDAEAQQVSEEKQDPHKLALNLFGVVVPLCTLGLLLLTQAEAIWHCALAHRFETVSLAAMLASVPIINFLTSQAISAGDKRAPIARAVSTGFAAGFSLIVLAVSCAASYVAGTDPSGHGFEFATVAFVWLLAAAVSIALGVKLFKEKSTERARNLTAICCAIGVGGSLVATAATETRASVVRLAQISALSDDSSEHDKGLTVLRTLNAESDLRLQCADSRTAGLVGIFAPVDAVAARQLFFAVTGKPYREVGQLAAGTMSDAYIKRHVVGQQIPGLSWMRSSLSGKLHPESLSARLNWTFVFKNKTASGQEARAELQLPPGASVSGLTLWMDGQPYKAAFASRQQAESAYTWVTQAHRDPALVTDLGNGRVFLRCAPVIPHAEMKVRLDIVAPMSMMEPTKASLTLPKIVDTDFAMSDDNVLRLSSTNKLSLPALHSNTLTTLPNRLTANLQAKELTGQPLSVDAARSGNTSSFSVITTLSKFGLIEAGIARVESQRPKQLSVVIDGSSAVKPYIHQIVTALKSVPADIPTTVYFSQADKLVTAQPLQQAVSSLESNTFSGGHDNLQALLKAVEEAGTQPGGAVVWIHGPQPALNEEIYIMEPFAEKPALFDLALDDDFTDTTEFLKNYRELGNIAAIPRHENVERDLAGFFAEWQKGASKYRAFCHQTNSSNAPLLSGEEGEDVSALFARLQVDAALARHDGPAALQIADDAHLVTPVSAAVVLEMPSDYERFGMADPNANNSNNAVASNSLNSFNPFAFGFARGALQATLSQSFDTVVSQLNALNAYSASGVYTGYSASSYSPSSSSSVVAPLGYTDVDSKNGARIIMSLLANLLTALSLGLGVFLGWMTLTRKLLACPLWKTTRGQLITGCIFMCCAFCVPGIFEWLWTSARSIGYFQ